MKKNCPVVMQKGRTGIEDAAGEVFGQFVVRENEFVFKVLYWFSLICQGYLNIFHSDTLSGFYLMAVNSLLVISSY